MLTAKDVLGQTAVHHAAAAGQSETLKYLLGAYYMNNESIATNSEGAGLLQMVCSLNECGIVNDLVM